MNKFITCLSFISSILFASNVWAENVVLSKAQDLSFKTENNEEIVYDKNGEPYSGAVVLPDEENRKVTYFYTDGKKHGVAFSRFGSGEMEQQITYVNGKKNGEEVFFYPNKNLKYRKNYKNNVLDGEEVIFYQNGKPEVQNHYKDGKLDGETRYFDTNGNQVKIEHYKAGIKDGIERIIKDNILREENIYINGKLNGTTKKYDTKYLTDEIQYVNGMREGLHKTYTSDGAWREIPYKNDKKEGIGKIFRPNKTLAESIVYANDKRNGLYQKFGLSGKLMYSINYRDNLKDGVSRTFNDEGKLQRVSYYRDDIELFTVEISKHEDLKNIQEAYFDEKIGKYSNKRNLWYRILWLGLNLNSPEILEVLENEMKMYALDNISDVRIYEKNSGHNFANDSKNMFFGMTQLDYAINIEAPTEILQKFISQIEDKNSYGLTPLQDAVRLNKTDMVKFLLLNGANINETDKEKNNILLYAIISEAPYEMIENLIKSGATVNAQNELGQTPLTVALSQKNTDLVKLLLQSGAQIQNMSDGQNMLFYAYDKKAPIELLNVLIDNKLDVNSTDGEGNNLLLKALKNKDTEVALFALNHGADINQNDNEGETAVSYVLYNDVSPEISEAIFALDYNYESKLPKQNKMLWKVLMEQNKLDLLKKTWDKMPDITTTADAMGEIPFKEAMKVTDNPELQELALSYIKKADDDMIWKALQEKDFALFENLLSKNGNINAKNFVGDSLLIYMIKKDYDQKYIDLIQSDKLIVDAEDLNDQTALDIALNKNNLELAEYLLKAGANPDHKVNGESFIYKATPKQAEQVKLLMKYTKTDFSKDSNALMKAVKNMNIPLFEYLLQQETTDFSVKDENGNSLLLNAADYFAVASNEEKQDPVLKENFLNIAKTLLDKGLDINLRNGDGETLLIKLAKYCGDEYDELARFLIDNGADTEPKDQYNKKAEDYRKDKQ